MSARENILTRLRAAPLMPVVEPEINHPISECAQALLLDEIKQNFGLLHAIFIDARNRQLVEVLAEICTERNVKKVILPPIDLLEITTWQNGPEILRFNTDFESIKSTMFNEVDIGITIADGAIAETGTLIQANPARMPRTMSLVPPIHICILDARKIYKDMQSALMAMQIEHPMPSNLIFISGPSKTADIQQTLAYGAHGPRELIVLLVEAV